MLSQRQRRALDIALLIVGIGMTAISIILVVNTDMTAPPSIRKLTAMLAPFGGSLLGMSWRRLAKASKLRKEIDEAIGYEEEPGYNSEQNKLLRQRARAAAAEITLYLFALAGCAIFILIDVIWISLTIWGICILHFIVEKCLISLLKRKSEIISDCSPISTS